MIESLRELSEVGKLAEKEALYLGIEVKKAVAELETFAQEKNITLENTVKGDFILQANRQELHLVLTNLLKNAIKYNKT